MSDYAQDPKEYTSMRDRCYESKRKKNGGKLSEEDMQECKKWSAVHYWKKHHKPVVHADINIDEIDLEIASEQLDFFGSPEEYDNWNGENYGEEPN